MHYYNTSSDREENSNSLGNECAYPGHMRDLHSIQVTLYLWYATASCHRLGRERERKRVRNIATSNTNQHFSIDSLVIYHTLAVPEYKARLAFK